MNIKYGRGITERKIVSFFESVKVKEISEQEVKQFCSDLSCFHNVNHEDDITSFKKLNYVS